VENLNALTFKAFIVSIGLLKEPLPKQKQAELNQIGREIALGYAGLGKLDNFAETYQPLDEIYQGIRDIMESPNVERSKGDFPVVDEAIEAENMEISNIVKAIDNEAENDKLDDWFLVLQDINSVQASKNKIKSLPLVTLPM